MLCSLIAYDADGNVVATLDHVVAKDADGKVVGLVDFESHELSGGEHTDIWKVSNASGSKVWPEWLGSRAHDFKVELQGPAGGKHIEALVHKTSGNRRELSVLKDSIAQRIRDADGKPADIRDIVGGPDRPLLLDDNGLAVAAVASEPTALPILPL